MYIIYDYFVIKDSALATPVLTIFKQYIAISE